MEEKETPIPGYLVRHDSWSFLSFKHKKSQDDSTGPSSMFPYISSEQLRKTVIPRQPIQDTRNTRHQSLIDMSVVSAQGRSDWAPFRSLECTGGGGPTPKPRTREGDRERDRKVWARDGEEKERRKTTMEIVKQLEIEMQSRNQNKRLIIKYLG